MTTAVFADKRQFGQRPHRSVAAQHSVSQLEQRIRTSGEGWGELAPEAWQFRQRLLPGLVMQQTRFTAFELDMYSLVGAHVQTKAALAYGDYRTE
ncbi:hypothetical protein [Streptomyces olivaceoviridis]